MNNLFLFTLLVVFVATMLPAVSAAVSVFISVLNVPMALASFLGFGFCKMFSRVG